MAKLKQIFQFSIPVSRKIAKRELQYEGELVLSGDAYDYGESDLPGHERHGYDLSSAVFVPVGKGTAMDVLPLLLSVETMVLWGDTAMREYIDAPVMAHIKELDFTPPGEEHILDTFQTTSA